MEYLHWARTIKGRAKVTWMMSGLFSSYFVIACSVQ